MKTKIVCILVMTLLIATVIPAVGTLNKLNNKTNSSIQYSGVEWSQTYGDESVYDTFYDVYDTDDGGYIMCGKHEENDLYYPYIVKADSMGNEEWSWSIQEFELEETTYEILENWVPGILQSSDGKYIACLHFQFEYEGQEVAAGGLVKLDESGNLEALYHIGEEDEWWIIPSELIEVDDGFVISGYGNYVEAVENDWDAMLVKTDLSGEIQWYKIYDYSDTQDEANALCQTDDNGFLLTGWVNHDQSDSQYRMIKTDSEGNEEWSQLFGGPDSDNSFHHDCFQTEDGGYIMGGQSNSFDLYDMKKLNAYIVRVDSGGNMLWDKIYGGKNTDTCWSMTMTDDNKYVLCVTMNFNSIAGDREDTHLVQLDDDGNVEWVQIFGGSGREVGTSVRQTDDGGFIVAGRNGGSYSSSSDAMLTKFAPFENQRPDKPDIDGPAKGKPDNEYTFTASASDPDGDILSYMWDWGDGNFSGWLDTNEATYTWTTEDNFEIRVMAQDENGGESDWSDPLAFSTPKNKQYINTPFLRFLENHPYMFPLLRQLLD